MEVKIFANHINHLTDARYFAAWGATWMCYNVSNLSLTEIAAIKEWVEGPKHIINVIGIDASEAAAMMTNTAVDGYLTDNSADHQSIQNLLQRSVDAFVISEGSIDKAKRITQVESSARGDFSNVICDVHGSPKEIQEFIRQNNPAAILLAGSEEEEVGVKSFDELDEILEWLEERE